MEALDKLDRMILRSLQADGRATYDQIAEQVSLSPSAVLRRVKRLEESGVIDRYAIIPAGFAATARVAGRPPFDLIFLDPPYGAADLHDALLAAEPLVGERTLLIVEHAKRDETPDRIGRLALPEDLSPGAYRVMTAADIAEVFPAKSTDTAA